MRSPLARISRTGATAGGFTTGHASSPAAAARARARRPGSVSVAGWTITAPERLRRHAEPLAERLVRGSPKGGFPECVPIILITPKCLGHHPNGSQIFACVLPTAMATRGEDALFTFCT